MGVEAGSSSCEVAEAGGAILEDFEGPREELAACPRTIEPVKNFTQQQDLDRGSDQEDGAGPAGRQWRGGDRDFRDVWGGGSAGLPGGLTGEGWGEADSGMAFWFLYLSAGVRGAHQALGPEEEPDSE